MGLGIASITLRQPYPYAMHSSRSLGFLALIGLVLVSVLSLHFNYLWNLTSVPSYFGSIVYGFQDASAKAALASSLVAQPPAQVIAVPVLGVPSSAIADTFGEPRGADREHQGIDIFATRGTYVLSATEGIVVRIGENRLGGNIVFVLGPGGERYYYAHLDSIDPALSMGQAVSTSTILGRVGTTGNAAGTPPHLHFGIYGRGGAQDPFGRLP